MRDPSATQRIATDPLQSVWVAANAGSGKTHVLVNRIARLLLAGAKPDRLLCVTFTRAAAAEMTTRLFKRLGEWALKGEDDLHADLAHLLGHVPDKETLARARLLFAEALELPGGLRIQTIHAFCERLLKRFPLEAGVVPQFSVLDERVAEELIGVARDEVLRNAHTDAQLREDVYSLTAHAGEEQFSKLMRDVASDRGWLAEFIYPPTRKASLERRIYEAVDLELGTTDEQILSEAVGAIDVGQARRAAAALARGAKSDQDRAPAFAAFAAQPDPQTFARVVGAVLTGDGEVRKRLATKDAIAADAGILDVLDGIVSVVLRAAERRNAVFVAENSSRLLRVSAVMLDAFQRAKQRRAALDYDDLITRVYDLFRLRSTASWVLYKLDGGIDHILVDEAQDTSRAQWNVVTPIAREFFVGEGVDRKVVPGERTLFVVGDTKQSIMSFQGAEPLAFVETHETAEAWARGARSGFESVTLLHSFRSAKNILRLVDQVVRDPAAQAGVQLDKNPVEHLHVRADMEGLVELWPVVEPPEREDPDAWDAPRDRVHAADPAVTLAETIAARIAGWIRDGEAVFDPQTRALRPMRPGDVMILVRRRALLAKEVIRQLKSRGVAVAGADRLKLTEHIAIQDLIALGRFALLPSDELTLAAVLKSPLCGLDDDALFELAYDRGHEGLWLRLRQRSEEPRFASAFALLERARNRADKTPPYEFYASLLSVDGGWRALLERLGPDAADPIDEFVNAALEYEREHTPSLEGFLHWIETAQTEIKRDQERGADAVRVMTVHAAKGLEAPVVILPDTCTTPEGGALDEQLLDAGGVPLWKIDKKRDVPVRARAREAAAEERMNEYQRLLYVALTRARDRLYVCGYTTSKGKGDGCWYELVERAMTALEARAIGSGDEAVKRFGAVPPTMKATATSIAGERALSPRWLLEPARVEVVRRTLSPSEAVRSGGSKPAQATTPAAGDALEWGRVIHRMLDVLANVERGDWESRAHAVAAHLLSDSARVAEAVAEALRVRSNPELAWLFGTGSYGEVSLRGRVNWRGEEVDVAARLDRVVDRGAGLAVIEFKTDRFVPARAEDISKAYVTQLALYARALAPLFPGKAISGGIVWTAVSRLDTLPSKLLEAAEG